MVYVKFQFVHTTTSKTGSHLLLASTSSNALRRRGSEKSFSEDVEVSTVCHLSPNLVTYHHNVASIPFVEVSRESCSVSSKGYPFTKSNEIGLGESTDLTALLSGKRQVSIRFNVVKQGSFQK